MPLRPEVSEQDHSQGPANARIILVKYGDYQCPHCARAYPIVKHLQQELGNDLRFVFRNFPLQKIHADAMNAALATEAAALQGKFWEMHDLLFENQDRLDVDDLLGYAEQLELDVAQFEEDCQREDLKEKIELDFESGIRSGVNATPTFYINGEKYNDGWESDRMLNHIRAKYY